jgi:hypothetical protein
MKNSQSRRYNRRNVIATSFAFTTFALLICTSNAAGQATITFDLKAAPTPLVAVPLEDMPGWLMKLRPAESVPESVRTVLRMSERAARMALAIPAGRLIGVLPVTGSGQDILFAGWSLDDAAGPTTLAVWDTTYYTAFLFIWNRMPFANAHDAELFTQRILPAEDFLSRLRVRMLWDGTRSKLFAEGEPTTFPYRAPIQILGVPAQPSSYVYALVVGKRLLGRAYDTGGQVPTLYVPERFPPLNERVGTWTKERLIAELDNGFSTVATNRDEILLTELLGRGLSADEFRQLFVAPGTFRVEHVMKAVTDTKRVAQYGRGLRDMLLAQTPGDPRSEETVGIALRYLRSSPDLDLCDLVSQFLARGAFDPWTFSYMEMCGRTQEHYDAVERAAASSRVSKAAQSNALGQIRRRMLGLGRQ